MALKTSRGSLLTILRDLALGALIAFALGPFQGVTAADPDSRELPLSTTISTWEQLARLTEKEATRGLPVRIRGVVVCYDREWGQLYIHDGRWVQYFSPAIFPESPQAGALVEVDGLTRFSEYGAVIDKPALRIVGQQELPVAPPVRLPELHRQVGQWVEISGQIRSAETSRGRLSVTVHNDGISCLVYVMGASTAIDTKTLLGREVRLRGINASKAQDGRLESASLFAAGTNELRIAGTPVDFSAIPTSAIDALLDREMGEWTNQIVRLSGLVAAYRPGEFVVLRDPTGTIHAKVTQTSRMGLGERIDLWGYLCALPGEPILTDAFFDLSDPPRSPPISPAPIETALPSIAEGLPLTQISNIFALSRDQLLQRLPVRIQGVVTYADAEYRNGFLQQGESAIYFDLSQNDVRAGHTVELRGVTDPGGFAPQINEATVEILGTATLPTPRRVTLDDLAGGHLDSCLVEMEGVVRRAEVEWNHLRLSVSSRRGRFEALVPGVTNASVVQHLVGSLVAVPGACASLMNARGQVSRITLHVSDLNQIRTLDPAPDDPFARTTTPIAGVSTFDASRVGHGRIKVVGTVTVQVPRSGIYIQDASGGLRLATSETGVFKSGDTIEAVGFPALDDFSPCLEEVVLRPGQPGSPAVPLQTTAHEILASGRADGLLIDLKARLIQRVSRSALPRLVLQDGPIVFTAYLVGQTTDDRLHHLEVGSVLQLTGVCAVQGGQSREPESFRLLIGSSADVRLLSRPSWWSARRALSAAGGLALAVILALAWAGSLRRRVQAQTEVIRRQLKEGKTFAESLDRERNLLATLIDHLPDHVFVKDNTGRMILTNHSYDRFESGSIAPPSTAPPPASEPVMTPEDRAVLIDGRSIMDAELALTGPDGAARWLSVSKVPLKDSSGSIVGLVGIRHDVTERKRAEAELMEIHRQLLAASHRAGMAEVATSVLHNVGNVLTSINVSVKCLTDQTRASKVSQIQRLAEMLPATDSDLANFLLHDPKGRQVPEYLRQLSQHLASEQEAALRELDSLTRNIHHVKIIVARQQSHARAAGVMEPVSIPELVDDAVSMCSNGPNGPRVPVTHRYPPDGVPTVTLDRHKALQILVNLIRNAIQACDDSGRPDPMIEVGVDVSLAGRRMRISVRDNGSGIALEHRAELFRYGFTTRQGGHGFGLHNSAVAARALGGELHADSEGPGRGATFTLDLPLKSHRPGVLDLPQETPATRAGLTTSAPAPSLGPSLVAPGRRGSPDAPAPSARAPVPEPSVP